MPKISKKKQLISKKLTPQQLTQIHEDDVELDVGDLINREPHKRSAQFFLGYYSKSGVKLALEKYGVFEALEKRGFKDLQIEVNTADPFQQRLCIFSKRKAKSNILVEIILKRKHLTTYTPFPSKIYGRNFEFLSVEWLTMQNPRAEFMPDRPRLPGQNYPGLREGRSAVELLSLACKRLGLAGILNVPEYFHNAQMYSKTFHFLNPENEGKRRAIARDLLKDQNLADTSWAIDAECVKENKKLFQWFATELIMPLDQDLQKYFSSTAYKNHISKAIKKYAYALDVDCWKKKLANIGTGQ